MKSLKLNAIYLFLILLCALLFSHFWGVNSLKEGLTTETYLAPNTSVTAYTGPQGNTVGYATGPQGNTVGYAHGNSFDNYNHYNGGSVPTVYYGPNGAVAKVIETNGAYSIIITDNSGNTTVYAIKKNDASATSGVIIYYEPNGGTATIVDGSNGKIIKVTGPEGNTIVFTTTNPNSTPTNTSATMTTGTYGASAGYVSGPMGNTAGYATGPMGNTVAGVNTSSSTVGADYSSVYPQGVSKANIPTGQEDLYILKSQIVPPVCPPPPAQLSCPREEKCPPCPACARCPEPSVTCKAVPNYNAINNEFLPQPVLNSFASFGM
jgi:hypothetical protein